MDFFIIPEIVLTYTIVFSPLILFKHSIIINYIEKIANIYLN
jgi:hypothetical protein